MWEVQDFLLASVEVTGSFIIDSSLYRALVIRQVICGASAELSRRLIFL